MEPSSYSRNLADDSLHKKDTSFIVTSSNWEIENNKIFDDCVSSFSLSQAAERTSLEDVVSLDTCVALKPDSSGDPCKLDFKVTNKQRITRIAVVSEALVLEFFKQSGEYATTSFAEFVDEFQDHAVYFAEANIYPPSSEASIKFTRTKNKGKVMWIYGIKLILTESVTENPKGMFDLDVINNFLSNSNQVKSGKAEMARKLLEPLNVNVENNVMDDDMNIFLRKLSMMNWNSQKFQRTDTNNKDYNVRCDSDSLKDISNLKSYIDNKFVDLEKKLIEKIKVMDEKTNQKLDAILKSLQLSINQ